MSTTLILTLKAQEDLEEAFQWYQKQADGLGKEFIRSVDTKLAEIKRHPLQHQVVSQNCTTRNC